MLILLVSAFVVATLAVETLTYLLWYYENRVHGASSRREPVLPYVTAWLADWAALMLTLPASLLGWIADRVRPAPQPVVAGIPVVLVHGWGMTGGAMALLAARLRRDGRDVYTVSYPSMAADVEHAANELGSALRRLAALGPEHRLDALAYGRGAIVLRAAARQGVAPLLRNVVTLGAPHQGSALAALIDVAHVRLLQPHSRYLMQLNEDSASFPPTSEWASIHSSFDAVVFPTELAYQPRALNIAIDWVGHHALILSERVYRLAKENLDLESHEA